MSEKGVTVDILPSPLSLLSVDIFDVSDNYLVETINVATTMSVSVEDTALIELRLIAGSIKGDKGNSGERGETGAKGDTGEQGEQGKSAYQSWLDAGNTGTEDDFLNWLRNINARVYIQETQPEDTQPHLWLQTNYQNPTGFTLWFDDGT